MKKETLEEAAENYSERVFNERPNLEISEKIWLVGGSLEGFIEGAKWQQERSYSEEYISEKLFNHPAMCRIRDSKSDAEARRIILELLKK